MSRLSAGEKALLDAAGHRLTVLHDSGLYRHLLFKNPTSAEYWFEIMTAPGTLTVHGDMGTYVIAREADMVAFLLGSAHGDAPNVSYWAEKCISTGGRRGLQEYSPARMRQLINEATAEEVEWGGYTPAEAEALRAAVRDLLARVDMEDEQEVREALRDFDHDGGNPFESAWEWEAREYSYSWQWTAHTLLRALRVYREQAAAVPAGPAFEQADLAGLHRGLVSAARPRPEYAAPEALAAYSEGAEHAIESLWRMGYRDAREVSRAWLNPGPVPVAHEHAQYVLSRDWPTLHRAVEAIARTAAP